MTDARTRATWQRHENFDAMAAMLLGIHDSFRAGSRKLLQLTSEPESFPLAVRLFPQLASALHHHHSIEERLVFPIVERTTGEAPDELVHDHQELMKAISNVEQALDNDNREASHTAMRTLHECLVDHLDREELILVPVLLEMDPNEMIRLLYGL